MGVWLSVADASRIARVRSDVCDHPFLSPNANKTRCHLPSRFDIALHYLKHGGRKGYKGTYEDMVPRMLVFIAYKVRERDGVEVLCSARRSLAYWMTHVALGSLTS